MALKPTSAVQQLAPTHFFANLCHCGPRFRVAFRYWVYIVDFVKVYILSARLIGSAVTVFVSIVIFFVNDAKRRSNHRHRVGFSRNRLAIELYRYFVTLGLDVLI